ncbi:MAG: exodeoxyribonuclease V subunit gamma [Anaerolineae bacterium]|nr:exodeoxyribonuclease V subunit gamma [Anaerolineae bacterium]
MGWLAVEQLEQNPALTADWRLLVVDGFDSFNGVTLKFLAPLAARVQETLVTLSGDAKMTRPVYLRFAQTRKQLEEIAAFETITLPPSAHTLPAPLVQLERHIFEPNPARIGPARHVEWLEAQTERLEAREALRWLKARIRRDDVPPDECAVIARDLGPYRAFLRQAAAEFGMPLRFLGGEPLVQNPAVIALLDVLELPLTWKRRALLDVVRSPYLDLTQFGIAPSDASKLALVARYGQVIEGRDQWSQTLARLAGATDRVTRDENDPVNALRGDAAQTLSNALAAFADRFTPPSHATLSEYLHWLQEKFLRADGLRLLEQIKRAPETYARDASALLELRDTLHALALAAQTTNDTRAIEYSAFLGELRGALDTASYDPDDPETRRQARIYAGNMNTTRGIPYRAAVILGLSEGIFPAPENEDPFLPDSERNALAAQGVPVEIRLRGAQTTLFYEAVTRASQYLLLTRPYLASDGESWEPSPYWEATRALFDAPPARKIRAAQSTTLSDAASRAELVQSVAARKKIPASLDFLQTEFERVQARAEILQARLESESKGIYDGDASAVETLLQLRYGDRFVASPSRLEKYGTCPFYFYIDHALGVEPPEPPTPGFDARQLGTLLHHILERVYRNTPAPQTTETLLQTLDRVAPPILDAAPDELGFRPTPLWQHERAALLDALRRSITKLNELAGDMMPRDLEKQFGGYDAPVTLNTSAGALRLRGTIDRVDADAENNLRLIDYKTGGSGYDKEAFLRGEHLQLPLYALAARQLYPESHVTDGFYWHIHGAKASAFKLSRFDYTDKQGRKFDGAAGAMEFALDHVGAFISNIRRGVFAPKPPENGCPDYCPARNFCWRYTSR